MSFKTGGYYGYAYVDADADWHAGDVFNLSGSSQVRTFQFSGTAGHSTDLTTGTFTGIQHFVLNGDTFTINSAVLGSAVDITGSGLIQTAAAAIDLSGLTTTTTTSFSSTNATGTAFTVASAQLAFLVTGGPGIDTIVGKGFSFTSDQRAEVFAAASVEIIQDVTATYGNNAGQTLTARATGDTVVGGTGNDTLISGVLNDTFTGGGGNDTFVFNTAIFGKDTITDFNTTTGILQFNHAIFADAATALSHAAQSGNDVVITYDAADTLTLKNILLANLHTSDFHIV